MKSNNKISNLVASQLPFYVRNDHENFVAFLEAYYEFLEQTSGVINVSKTMLDQMDIDKTDLFANNFYQNFISLIPQTAIADKNIITKKIKDFYLSRGSEKSVRFLMRVLFNEEVEFYYPKVDVLRASDGKWFVEKSIKITDVKINGVANNNTEAANKFIGSKITGSTTNSSAIVERVDTYYEGSSLVRELKITGLYKSFGFGETISAPFFENGILKTITANLFSGGINTVKITNPGVGYSVGDEASVEGGNGSGAVIRVSSVSAGDLTAIATIYGGAGYQVNNRLFFSGSTGNGATGNVITVKSDNSFHPNSYNVTSSTIDLEIQTPIGNAVYSNLKSDLVGDPANNWIQNSMSFFTYANTGPIVDVLLISKGSGYTSKPTISVEANNRVRELGILGRMEINNGGQGYVVGDTLVFENVLGGYGTGAAGRVKTVNTSSGNAITSVEFVQVPGHMIGGTGYDQSRLPKITVNSSNASAYGANIAVTSVLGFGERIAPVGSSEGAITGLTILLRGSGYDTVPIINLKSKGDGTAQAVATIITGSFEYPGRYINDDGHLSSYNFIQDRDYYQSYSYVVKLKRSLDKYIRALKELIHPAGMKLFGEYVYVDNGETLNANIKGVEEQISVGTVRNYYHNLGNVMINYISHGLSVANTVYVEWATGNVANARAIANSAPFYVKQVINVNNFTIVTNSYPYLSNTLLPAAGGTANVYKIVL